MAQVSNMKINERSNVKRPNLRITKIGNKIEKLKHRNSKICQFSKPIMVEIMVRIEKIPEIC